MNGAADMGGMHGFGPVEPEPNEPIFHAEWEKTAFAIVMALGPAKLWGLDEFRYYREKLPPPVYLNLSYYGLWIATMESIMVDYGVATPAEIKAGHAIVPVNERRRTVTADDVRAMVRSGGRHNRPATTPALFKVGDRVRTKNIHPTTHTRLPRYARGRNGHILRVIGCHVFPDSKTTGAGEDPHWLYTVCFSGRELWGENSDPSVSICIDAWEPYLQSAPTA